MKKPFIIVSALLLPLLASCYVVLTNPIYVDKEVLFDKALLGKWVDTTQADAIYDFTRRDSLSYTLNVKYKGAGRGVFEARLFRFNGKLMLDVTPRDSTLDRYVGYLLVGRALYLVDTIGSRLSVHGLDYEWLDSVKSPIIMNIPVEGEVVRLLADSTEALREFVKSTMDKGLFVREAMVLKRKRG
jgi:hypothetical protein